MSRLKTHLSLGRVEREACTQFRNGYKMNHYQNKQTRKVSIICNLNPNNRTQ